MTEELEIHPIAKIFPVMSAVEQASLEESVLRSGLRKSIVMLDGMILDGRHRYRACLATKVPPRFRVFGSDPTDGDSPVHFVADNNIHRRHLTTAQRAAAAEEMLPFREAESASATEALTSVAKDFAVSETSVRTAREIRQADPEVAEQVKAGEISLHAAKDKVNGKGKTTSTPEEEAESQLPDPERDKVAATFEKPHGEAFALAVKNRTILKTVGELAEFEALPKEDQKLVVPLVVKGWKVKKANRFVHGHLTGDNTLADLVLQTACVGKPIKVEVDGYVVTARRATGPD